MHKTPVIVVSWILLMSCSMDTLGKTVPDQGFDFVTADVKESRSQSLHISINKNGEVETVPRSLRKSGEKALSKFSLKDEHTREVAELLKKTDWLRAPTPDLSKPPFIKDGSTFLISLTQGQRIRQVECRFPAPEPYTQLAAFFMRIWQQECLLQKLSQGSPDDIESACREIANIFYAKQGKPVSVSPYEILYWDRFVPALSEILDSASKRSIEELIPAIQIVGFLNLEKQRANVASLYKHKDWGLKQSVVDTLVQLGGKESLAVLLKMLREHSYAAWGLIQLEPLTTPALVQILEAPWDPNNMSYEHIIRAYIDNWDKLKGRPLDPRIISAVRKSRVTAGSYRVRYHDQLLKLAEEAGEEGK